MITNLFTCYDGECGLTTMRVVGEVGYHKLNILLDTGSTLSFLQEDTAKKFGCLIHSDEPLLVRLMGRNWLVQRELQILNGLYMGMISNTHLDY